MIIIITYIKDVQYIQGVPTPMIRNMKNHLENSHTTMHILNMKYDVKFETNFLRSALDNSIICSVLIIAKEYLSLKGMSKECGGVK